MPVFEVDIGGKTFEVDAPDQATALSSLQGQQEPSVASRGEDIAKSLGIGAVKGGVGLLGLPGDVAELGAKGIDTAAQWIGSKLGIDAARPSRAGILSTGMHLPGSQELMSELQKYTGELRKPQTTAGEYAQTVGEFLPAAAMGPGGVARRVAMQAVLPGVASEAAGQATKGTGAEPWARIGGALGGAIAPSVAGRIITPLPASAERQRLVGILADEGVNSLTAGQRTGNKTLQYAESVLGDAPGAGSQAARVQQEGQRQFTEAAVRRAGTGPSAAPEVLAENNARLGREFSDLSARNTLAFDQQFTNDITTATRNYQRVPPSQQRAIVENYVDDIVGHMQEGGMPGPQYQEMRSRLSKQSNSLRNSDPTLSEALRDMRNALDNAMGRSISPDDLEAWQTARRQYGAQKVIEKTASRAGEATAEGQIVPANLRNTVAAENRGAYARGQGNFSELARAGSGVMAPLPQSGTGPRVAMSTLGALMGAGAGSIAGAGGAGLGAASALVAGPAVAGRALMSRPVQAYLANQAATPYMAQFDPRRAALIQLLASQSRPRIEAR